MSNIDRALARIVVIDDVKAHPNKKITRIELATIGGWQCVVKKGEFKKGDVGLYCEVDSLLPLSVPEFAFLEERGGIRAINDVSYARIRSTRIQGELSQGLLIKPPKGVVLSGLANQDLTKELGILKYEKPSEDGPQSEPVTAKPKTWVGRLVAWLRKDIPDTLTSRIVMVVPRTDQERVQNMTHHYHKAREAGETFEKSYKLNGESFTAYRFVEDGNVREGVNTRKNAISLEDIHWTFMQSLRYWLSRFIDANSRMIKDKRFYWPGWKTGVYTEYDPFIQMYRKLDLKNKLTELAVKYGLEVAIQGELIGPGRQGNKEGLLDLRVYFFSLFLINDRNGHMKPGYVIPSHAREIIESMGLAYVPVAEKEQLLPETIAECLEDAAGPSFFTNNHAREGFVYKSNIRDFSFKVISNKFLLENEDE